MAKSTQSTSLKLFQKIFGTKQERDKNRFRHYVDDTLKAYAEIDKLSNDELRARSAALRQLIKDKTADKEARMAAIKEELEKDIPVDQKVKLASEADKLTLEIDDQIENILDEILPEAFAIIKSTARRFNESEFIRVTASDFDRDLAAKGKDFVHIEGDEAVWQNHWIAGGNEIKWDMVHYDCQLYGGAVLTYSRKNEAKTQSERNREGNIAEMATGEGKTLVATLPVFLNALAGKGVHVVTVNDYLSKRDSEWMGPLYQFHGLSVDCIDKHQPNSDERKRAYACDITFGTNNEFGFDYLRDNMAHDKKDQVQGKLHYAIVDEADSVLIDDARTPLIISGPVPKGEDQQFEEYNPYVQKIYELQRRLSIEILNDAKKTIAAGDLKEGGKLLLRAYKANPKYNPIIKFLSEQGMKKLCQDTEDFYLQDNEKEMHIVTDPLYYVVDEKQHTSVLTDKGRDYLCSLVNDSSFFVIPDVGATIAEIEKSDLSFAEKQTRKDEVMADFSIKSERVHTVNQLIKAYTLFIKEVDYVIIEGKVKIVDEQTGRIMEGRRWSDGLHQAVEAKEGVKIEAATQTFATITLQNYFRMYHKLTGMTGTAETEAGEFWSIYKLDVVVITTNRPIARVDQDDLIYKTRAAKRRAVVKEVQRLVAEGRPVLIGTTSVESSESFSRDLRMRGIPHQVLNAKEHAREAEVVAHAGRPGTVTIATNMAGRGTDIKLTPEVKEAGGLAIIGTERHESRRVDRQLRGRAGRQGDPGSSRFYISLEDDLMRLFGSERIASVVDKLGMGEDEALEAPMLSNAIEKAQKKKEEINFGSRKRLLEYDDVMNSQRTVVYSKRQNALSGERIEIDVLNMMQDTAEILADNMDNFDYQGFSEYVMSSLSIDLGFDEETYDKGNKRTIAEALYRNMLEVYNRRMDTLSQKTLPIIKDVYENQGDRYINIAIPVTDGIKMLTISVNLKKAVESNGKEIAKTISKIVSLWKIDDYWQQHLRDMDDLKQSVQNASYEQKDPILIYKLESYNLFHDMLDNLNKDILSFLLRAQIALRDASSVKAPAQQRRQDNTNMRTSRTDLVTNSGEPKSNMPVRVDKQVGRNDPCPCGSGLKFKNCHGKGL